MDDMFFFFLLLQSGHPWKHLPPRHHSVDFPAPPEKNVEPLLMAGFIQKLAIAHQKVASIPSVSTAFKRPIPPLHWQGISGMR